jgi:hypothetical protein
MISCSRGFFKSIVLFASLFIINAWINLSSAAQVESLSSEILKHQGDDAYWQVDVKCDDGSAVVSMRQTLRQFDWCVIGKEMPCEPTKQKMAKQLCASFTSLVQPSQGAKPRAASKPSQSAQRPASISSSAEPISAPLKKSAPADKSSIQTESERTRIAARKKTAEARRAAERARARAALLTELRENQQLLKAERQVLDKEKLDIQVLEAELSAQANQIQSQLNALSN